MQIFLRASLPSIFSHQCFRAGDLPSDTKGLSSAVCCFLLTRPSSFPTFLSPCVHFLLQKNKRKASVKKKVGELGRWSTEISFGGACSGPFPAFGCSISDSCRSRLGGKLKERPRTVRLRQIISATAAWPDHESWFVFGPPFYFLLLLLARNQIVIENKPKARAAQRLMIFMAGRPKDFLRLVFSCHLLSLSFCHSFYLRWQKRWK